MLGANPLVRDDVRVLLRSMGYHCVVAATLEHALELPEREQPDAAILDPHFPDSPPARVVAMFHKRVPDLRNRFIVLVREEGGPELLQVLEDRKSTRLNSSHTVISYAVFCLKKKI